MWFVFHDNDSEIAIDSYQGVSSVEGKGLRTPSTGREKLEEETTEPTEVGSFAPNPLSKRTFIPSSLRRV